ncbi:MAG: Rid family hydrolase [Candidatus Woesearchaeota archaeon]
MGLKDGKLAEGLEAQTRQAIENVKAILAQAGWNLSNLTKVRIFLTDMKDYGKVNEIYGSSFSGKFPTRVALAVKDLPLGALIELDCTAMGDSIRE